MVSERSAHLHGYCSDITRYTDDFNLPRRKVVLFLRKYSKRRTFIDEVDINVRVSPHTFRHTFAKRFIKKDGNIFALQKILGHSVLDMVRTYVNLFSSEVDDEHRKASPLNNIIKQLNTSYKAHIRLVWRFLFVPSIFIPFVVKTL